MLWCYGVMTGLRRVQLYLKDCPSFDGYVYDSFTGWNTVSRIIIEEISPSELFIFAY